jgi:hypothetical protein
MDHPTALIAGKFSIYYPYIMEKFPSIVILHNKTWKNSSRLFHVLLLLLNITENQPKFKPNPKLRLMDQAESGIMGRSGRVDYEKKPAPIFCTKKQRKMF